MTTGQALVSVDMGKRKTTYLTSSEFKYRLWLVAKARGMTIRQLHKEGEVNPRHTRDIVSRGKSPTFKLIRRLIEPQGVSLTAFCGDIKTLVANLKHGE